MIPIIALGLTALAGLVYLVVAEYRLRSERARMYASSRPASERIAEAIRTKAAGREPVTPFITNTPAVETSNDTLLDIETCDKWQIAPLCPPDSITGVKDPARNWERWLYITEKLTRVTYEDIDYHIHSLSQLPSNNFPILKEIERENSSPEDVSRTIESDWNLSVRILKLANSAFYSTSEEVTNVKRAITLLGFETVRSLVYVNMILDSLGQSTGPISAKHIFLHCLATSCAATHFANGHNPAARNLIATAGLFHDIGKLACARVNRVKTEAALDAVDKDNPFDRTQLEAFGISHYLITKMLLDTWHFPSALTRAIIGLAPDAPSPGEDARALMKAGLFASHIGYTACGTEMDTTGYNFGLSPEQEASFAESIRSRVAIYTKI
jgi:HD-like signal output (HDOD) protein